MFCACIYIMRKQKKKKECTPFSPIKHILFTLSECAIDDVREKKKETNVGSTHGLFHESEKKLKEW